jgi:CheY-like chemotaxis protein
MEGLSFTRTLHDQQETGGKFIPVLLTGSEFTHQQIVEAIQTGVSQILVSPITTSGLGRKVESIRSALNPAA